MRLTHSVPTDMPNVRILLFPVWNAFERVIEDCCGRLSEHSCLEQLLARPKFGICGSSSETQQRDPARISARRGFFFQACERLELAGDEQPQMEMALQSLMRTGARSD